MTVTEPEDRVAIVLAMLGDDLAEPLLAQISPQRREQVRQRVASFNDIPPSASDVDRVMDDFARFFRFVEITAVSHPRLASGLDDDDMFDSQSDAKPLLKPSKDPLADLSRLEAYQIAGALQREHPRTIAIVLNYVPTEKASSTLNYLPSDVRTDVFLQLRDRPQGSEHLIKQIARATFDTGREITEDDVVADDTGSDQRLASILRTLDKKERDELFSVIREHDPDTADRVSDLLYLFDDLKHIADRSLQKLLSEVDTRVLAMSLKNADDAIANKVLKNLPKRARDMLAEEMQFMGQIGDEDLEAARKEVTGIIAQLDQAGELIMEM